MAQLVCNRCPQCGCPEFDAVTPNAWVAFAKDRVCQKCQTRYGPPTPRWAAIVFLLVGGLFSAAGILGLVATAKAGTLAALPGRGVDIAFACLVGLPCLVYGLRSFRQRPATAPDWGGAVAPPAPRRSYRRFVVQAIVLAMAIGGFAGVTAYVVSKQKTAHEARAKQLMAAIYQIDRWGGSVSPHGSLFDPPEPNIVHLHQGVGRNQPMTHEVTDDDLRVLEVFKPLDALNIKSASVTNRAMAHLQRQTQLTHLTLACPQLTDEAMALLSSMPRLQRLFLPDTQLTDEGLAKLPQFSSLTEIDLSGTGVTDDGIQNLARFPLLATVWLGDTAVTPQGIAELQQKLPRCEIAKFRND